jgi:tRNA (uracil-5-)-methyltransferase
MDCKYFGVCGSCKLYEYDYAEQLNLKKLKIKEEFKSFEIKKIDVITSKESHFRNRAEFRIWHEADKISFAMHRLDGNGLVMVDNCPMVSEAIYELMPKLKIELQNSIVLKEKLFAVEFLSSTTKDVLVTLIYHKKIDKIWENEAFKIADKLKIKIIGRSRKVRLVLSEDFINEELEVDKSRYKFYLHEGGFTQPNSFVNSKMITWVVNKIKKSDSDLLELYCGHGNFTIPLSKKFAKVLATEISKTSIKSAKENSALNKVQNIFFLRMSSQELTSALKKERKFRRLKNIDLDSFDFSTVFVDPPRAGLDEKSLEFIKNFKKIIYISCNWVTLKRDLLKLKTTHKIEHFAIFDQFPYTHHLESGVILTTISV